jgi:hypothetical protein
VSAWVSSFYASLGTTYKSSVCCFAATQSNASSFMQGVEHNGLPVWIPRKAAQVSGSRRSAEAEAVHFLTSLFRGRLFYIIGTTIIGVVAAVVFGSPRGGKQRNKPPEVSLAMPRVSWQHSGCS